MTWPGVLRRNKGKITLYWLWGIRSSDSRNFDPSDLWTGMGKKNYKGQCPFEGDGEIVILSARYAFIEGSEGHCP
ncbi:MAG: hypothetical protein Roseis2KO_50180 [Roseivirga sp.]